MTRWVPPRHIVAERNLRNTRRAVALGLSIATIGMIVAGAAAFGAPIPFSIATASSFVAILGFISFTIAKTTYVMRSPQWCIEACGMD